MSILHKTVPPPAPIRAVLYARVSSDNRGKDGRNLQSQLEMCREYALEHDWHIVEALAEDDRGASGASFQLEKLNRVLEMALAGEFDVLVVRELDRLSRKLAKQLIVEEELRRHGVQVEYVLADYANTPEGNLMKNVRAVIAEYERLKIAERMERGRWQKVKAGNVMTFRRPPFGYGLSNEDGKANLIVNESEARVVRLIFSWYTEGDELGTPMSIADIARRLGDMKIPTRGDTDPKRHGGKKRGRGKWPRGTVHSMLRNETYAGVWHFGKTVTRGGQPRTPTKKGDQIAVAVPSIVSREAWEAVQARLDENRRHAARVGVRKHDYLVGRRVTCGVCGLKMVGSANGPAKSSNVLLCYRCPSRVRKGLVARQCEAPGFRADHVDAEVWHWVKSFLTDTEALASGLAAYQDECGRENEPILERLAVVKDLILFSRAQLERLLDLYLLGDFPKEVLSDRKTRVEATISALKRERAGLVAHLETETLSEGQVQTLKEFVAKVNKSLEAVDEDFETRRRVIEMLDVHVTLVMEDGEKVIFAQCLVGGRSWAMSGTIGGRHCQLSQNVQRVRVPALGPTDVTHLRCDL